jgi:hypothetical protein
MSNYLFFADILSRVRHRRESRDKANRLLQAQLDRARQRIDKSRQLLNEPIRRGLLGPPNMNREPDPSGSMSALVSVESNSRATFQLELPLLDVPRLKPLNPLPDDALPRDPGLGALQRLLSIGVSNIPDVQGDR